MKVYKNKVQVKSDNSAVRIQTINKNIFFYCENSNDAKNIVKEITNVKTGTTKLERGKNKIKKIIKSIDDSKEVIITGVDILTTLIGIFKKKK